MDPDLSRHWRLEPGLTFLNHGSFGACPGPVLDTQAALRERMELDPVRFLATDLQPALDRAREALAAFLHADPADCCFVSNATSGVNTVLRSLEPQFRPGDELLTTDQEYNATRNALSALAGRTGARVVVARIRLPVRSDDDLMDAIVGMVGPRTKLAMLSHVTSATAIVFPIERLARALSERGVDLLVDAAHSPGMLSLDLRALGEAGATWVTGNCHKWFCSPKGAGFLWARGDRRGEIHPLVTSHGANAPLRGRSLFHVEADWTGTTDPTPALSLPAALDFMAGLHPNGWPGLMAANHELALAGAEELRRVLGTEPLVPDSMIGSMVAMPLPPGLLPGTPADPAADPDETLPEDPLHDELLARYRIQVPVYTWPPIPRGGPGTRLIRISAQRYNDMDDYRRLAGALGDRGR